MKIGFLILFVFSALICSHVRNNPSIKKNDCGLNQEISEIIEQFRLKTGAKSEDMYYFLVFFYEKNDSNFMAITCNLKPPYISSKRHVLGFIRCGQDYIIFSNTASREIVKNLLKDLELNKNIKSLEGNFKDEGRKIEALIRHYYIDDHMKLVFKEATNYL